MRLIAIDAETGGFKAPENALLSLTLIALNEDLSPGEALDLFILPEPDRTVEEGAAKINGYTPELWAERNAIPLAVAMERARQWVGDLGGGVALAHNAPFDRGFVTHQEERLGIQLGLGQVWTCSLAKFRESCRPLGIKPANHKLETLARLSGHWGPEFVRGAHGSKEDALACAAGYRWLLEQVAAKQAQKAVARG